jgi:hypothetical protein
MFYVSDWDESIVYRFLHTNNIWFKTELLKQNSVGIVERLYVTVNPHLV